GRKKSKIVNLKLPDKMFELDDFLFFEVAPPSAWEILFGEVCIHHTVQSDDVITKMFEYPSNNPVFTTMDLDTDFPFACSLHIADRIGLDKSIFKFQTEFNFIQITLCQVFIQFYVVYLSNVIAGMGQFFGKTTIIGQ